MSFYEGNLHITLVVGSHEFFCTVIDASWTLYFLMKSSVPGFAMRNPSRRKSYTSTSLLSTHNTYFVCIIYIGTLNTLQFHLPVMSTLGGSAIVEVWISDFLNQAGFCNIIFLNIILRPNRTAIMFTLKNVNWKKKTLVCWWDAH